MVKVSRLLEELQTKLAALEASNQKLEARIRELEHPSVPAIIPAPALAKKESISEEVMLVIAAAVAAYCGERAHIRVVRLVPSRAWAQQGRVSIQASHHLA